MKNSKTLIILTLTICFAAFIGVMPLCNPAQASDEIPAWIKSTKFKGDFRFRYQSEDVPSDENTTEQLTRDRWRLRWRFGMESEPNEQWKVGFGLASGSADPRSTNQTLENFFDTPDARLDYAYATWTPMETIELTLGKFKNPIWNPKDLLWDSDIMPEGLTATFNFKTSDNAKFFITPVFFILDEYKDEGDVTNGDAEDDPNMMAIQAGTTLDFEKAFTTTLGVTYYKYNNTADIAFFQGEDDASAWSVEAEAGFTALPVYVGLFGQYVASDADDNNTGYLFGVKCGDKKIKALGDWELKYNYRKLETLAWWDQLPDSDFLGGDTNVKGSEVELTVGLHKNVTLGLDYYKAEVDDTTGYAPNEQDQDLIQLDLLVKFP